MKKIFLHISALSLMIYMLFSSMGVLVYEHHCSQAGTFYGVSSEFDHHCEDKKEEISTSCKNTEKSCCEKPTNEKQASNNCCTTDVNWVQLDTDLSIHNLDFEFDKGLNIAFISNFKLFQPQSKNKTEECRGPPPKLLKPSHSSLQSYLI
jgi:hypothetical protein